MARRTNTPAGSRVQATRKRHSRGNAIPDQPQDSIEIWKDWKKHNMPFNWAVKMYLSTVRRIPAASQPEGLVFHYTNAVGLLGIISSHRFWASNTAFLNDPSEGQYVLDIAKTY